MALSGLVGARVGAGVGTGVGVCDGALVGLLDGAGDGSGVARVHSCAVKGDVHPPLHQKPSLQSQK